MKIKHYTLFSNSHKIFLKYFLNTFPFDEDVDLQIRYIPQECKSGEYAGTDWHKPMGRKIKLFLDIFEELKNNDLFIYSDPDIVFFKNYKTDVLQEMEESDIIFQSDVGLASTGFFACRITPSTKNFFQHLYNRFNQQSHFCDQEAVNAIIRNQEHNLKIKLFSSLFFNHGFFKKHYNNESDVSIPQDIVLFHANFVYSLEQKNKLIGLIANKIQKKEDFNIKEFV